VSDDLSIPNPGYRANRVGQYGIGQSRVRQGMDPDTRRLVVFAGGLGIVLAALIGASTLIGRHSTEVPVIAADGRPIRVKPENPGGMKIDGAENDVFSGGSDTANAKLAPPPENPDAKALRTTAATAPPVTASAPVGVALPLPPPPVTKPAVAPAASAAAEAHPPASAHQTIVQLAALTSEEAARSEWQQLSKSMPDLLNGRQPVFSRTERYGHTFWRVRTAGFADVAQARTFCDRVRAKGAGCSVADF